MFYDKETQNMIKRLQHIVPWREPYRKAATVGLWVSYETATPYGVTTNSRS